MNRQFPSPLRLLWRMIKNKYDSLNTDAAARRALNDWNERDTERLEFYRQFIPPESLVFDVGANMGNRAKIFVHLAARVVAIEPQKRCINILRSLQTRFPQLKLICSALGSNQGKAKMLISPDHTLSSLSEEWVKTMRISNRFGGDVWKSKKVVQVRTLDDIIKENGTPSFIKIDVEGYEDEVLAGLTSPVNAVSIEFTPERMNQSFRSIDRLDALGLKTFNFALGEVTTLELPLWVSADAVKEHLLVYTGDTVVFGDIYARKIEDCNMA